MPKLKLKRTPAEEAANLHNKSKKRKLSPNISTSYASTSHAHDLDDDSDSEYGPQPHASSSQHKHRPDYDTIFAEVEDARFRDKLSMAMEDDGQHGDFDRLDALESRFNEYAHVPDRYRTSARNKHQSRNVYDDDENYFHDAADNWAKLDPRYMDDEEYAEYVRMGMYRKTHVREYEEKERRKQARAERRAQKTARKEELKRLEKEEEEKRKQKKAEKDARKWVSAKKDYDERWKEILSGAQRIEVTEPTLRYADIPWPAFSLDRDITEESIRSFVLMSAPGEEFGDKHRKERLRETMLRFHPDKFEGRIMVQVRDKDRERVKETMGLVVRTVQKLMTDS